MTALLRSTPHSQLPASQTAPVAEFRCLYTPDIRKKQKKWQDGYLKFHSFNSRVMVYDQGRNFLGDTYYKDSDELHEGDELTLDKGIMVEVAEAMGTTQTDLKPLFEKRPKEPPPPPSAPPRRFQPPTQVVRPQVTPAANSVRANAQQPRHRSLNTLLGTPKGPIGKSVPIVSPYEARREKEREKENDFAVDRVAKRQKTAHTSTSSATLRVSSPVLEESPAPRKSISVSTKDPRAKPTRPARPIPKGASVIHLDDNDVTLPPSSPPSLPGTPPPVSRATVKPAVSDRPALQTLKIPRGKVPVPSVKAARTPQAPALPSSPPVSAANRLTNVDFAVEPTPVKESTRKVLDRPVAPPIAEPSPPPRNLKAKSLRLSKGVKRGTLMICQPPPSQTRSRDFSEVRLISERPITRTALTSSRHISPPLDTTNAAKPKRSVVTNSDNARKRTNSRQVPPRDAVVISDDDQEAVLGAMDQRLLVAQTPPPETSLVPASPERIAPKPKVPKATGRQQHKATVPPSRKSRSVSPLDPVVADVKEKQDTVHKVPASRNISSKVATAVAAEDPRPRVASPALSAIFDSESRMESLSPRKLAALSTGGFRGKTKTATPPPNVQGPIQSAPAPRNQTVALPPHPLRSNKNGPVMTTTELAAKLQQPKRKPKATADHIEDEADVAGISPNRKFRRVRSENDAPIPSTSEEWEKRNLPKATPDATTTAPEAPAVAARKKSGLAALIKKTDPCRQLARTKSLTIDSNIAPVSDMDSPMVSPVTDKDVGPWSTEAFDLFDWRPPREEAGTGIQYREA
ncbi:hypothetical protein G6514_009689 [Epicoccum nigrum]|nr:hypothetical protein G6514_009689 [Epicoccum nigrum]